MCEEWRAREIGFVTSLCSPSNFKVVPSAEQSSGLDILSFAAVGLPSPAALESMGYVYRAVMICIREQQNLWSQYITEVVRYVTRRFHDSLSTSESEWAKGCLPMTLPSLFAVNARYSDAMVF